MLEPYLGTDIWDSSLSPKLLQLHETFVKSLPEQQRDKIEELRKVTQDVLQPNHTDCNLYKWLKARKFDVNAAETMLRANLKWRAEMRMDTIYNYKPLEVLEKYLPFRIFGQDKEDCHVIYVNIEKWDIRGTMYSVKMADQMKYYMVILETCLRLNQKQSELKGKLITKVNVILDVNNFKLQDYIWRPVLEILTTLLKHMEANYPEFLKRVYVVNAPRIFSILFAMLKPFLSEDTKKKIVIYGKDSWKEVLLEAIDENEMPAHYGGTIVDEIDGDPHCYSKLGAGGKIPESYYLTRSKRNAINDKLQSEIVDRNSTHKISFAVEKAGSTITWTFETEDSDIGFGISYKTGNNKSEEKINLYPVTRYDCHLAPEEGTILCDKTGIYTIVFDNRYSWYKSKKIFYDIRVTEPVE